MGLLNTLLRAVTWWNDATLNTLFYTWRKGIKVGEDEQGNVYYRDRDDKHRWVIFNGEAEASRIGTDWHGWLHHTYDAPPTEKPLKHKPWEKPHLENLTGTPLAYAPAGSILRSRPKEWRDYEPWAPE